MSCSIIDRFLVNFDEKFETMLQRIHGQALDRLKGLKLVRVNILTIYNFLRIFVSTYGIFLCLMV